MTDVFSGEEKSELKKTIITLSMAATVGLSSLFTGVPTETVLAASKIEDLKAKSNEIQSKRSGIESEINEATSQIEAISTEMEKVNADINRIDLAIGDTMTKIAEKNQQIAEKKTEIAGLKSEIEVLIERIEQRNELLKERARSYQEGGGMVSYLDVLVGAQSFSDFIDRVGAVAVILEADQAIMQEHNADKEALEQKKAKVQTDLTDLEKMRQELETLKANLGSQKVEKDQLMASLEKEEAQANQLVTSLEEEEDILTGQAQAIKKAIQLEQKKQAQAAAAAAAARAASTQQSSSNSSQNAVATAPVSSGTFTSPTQGSITSGFGYRTIFGQREFHYGVDIAKRGTVPVVAAADGVILRSQMMGTYGNVIMISHSIDGQTYTTVYAHLNSRLVGNLATVSKGQIIGYMGTTGRSSGQHLHFELHRGEWNGARSNAINPVGIVPM